MKPEKKVYKSFYELKEPKLYYNQIKEYTDLSHSSLQNTLNKLVKSSILKEEKTKGNTFYLQNNKKILQLEFSEIAINKFEDLNADVKNPLRNFLKNIPKEVFTIILFGSASKKEEQKNSDIDLMIVSGKKIDVSKNKKEGELTSKYPISIFQVSTKEFFENKDDLVIQARKTGFPIYKEQNFYEVLLDEYN